jgi:hypothetical protein
LALRHPQTAVVDANLAIAVQDAHLANVIHDRFSGDR